MSSKIWRKVGHMLPPENHPVLVLLYGEEYPYVAAWDGEIWYEWHLSTPLHDVSYWMYFPINQNE